jgi:hypothetical protein
MMDYKDAILGRSTFVDSTNLQYALWKTIMKSMVPPPERAKGPYRPSYWGSGDVTTAGEGMTYQTIITDDVDWYVFDAVLKLDHSNSRRITEHPIQTGANISDHSYQLPASLTIEVGMSDVMDNYRVGQWGTSETTPTKSIAAYEKILEWQKSGNPLTVSTRLATYENMVIEHVSAPDDVKTKHGLRCMVSFKQIITAEVASTPATSAIQQVNITTDLAQIQAVQDLGNLYGLYGMQ